MTTYNTGNPIGSKDPRDLYDNAENLDVAVNDDAATWVDRLGVQRSTLWQMLEYSKQFNDRGDWHTSTAYARKDYFTYGGVAYVTLTAHTSTSVAADLAAGKIGVMSGNSGAMDFLQAGTGAVARSVESKLRDVVSVKDFGAVGDGSADDTAAIQAALTAAAGKTLYFPSGQYKISTSLIVEASYTTILGAGKGNARIVFSGATDGIILKNGVSLSQIVIENISIFTSNTSGGKALHIDFSTGGGSFHRINNVYIGITGSGRWEYGLYARNFQSSEVINLGMYGGVKNCVNIGYFSNALRFYGLELGGDDLAEIGIEVADTELYFYGGTVQANFNTALMLIGGSPRVYGLHFENTNKTPTAGADIVFIHDTSACIFEGNEGGTFKTNNGVTVRQLIIANGNFADVTFGNTTSSSGIVNSRMANFINNGSFNFRLNCSEYNGSPLSDFSQCNIPGMLLAQNDATPSVAQGNRFRTYSTTPTTITDFVDGYAGQEITIYLFDTNTTISAGGNLLMSSPFGPIIGAWSNITFVNANGALWVEKSRVVLP